MPERAVRYAFEFVLALVWGGLAMLAMRIALPQRAALRLPAGAAAFVIVFGVLAAHHHAPLPGNPAALGSAPRHGHAVACGTLGARVPGTAHGALDMLISDEYGASPPADGALLDRRLSLIVDGWALQTSPASPARAVCAIFDGRPVAQRARYGDARADVGAAFADARLAPSGFHLEVPLVALAPGPHVFDLAVRIEGGRYQLLGVRRRFTLR